MVDDTIRAGLVGSSVMAKVKAAWYYGLVIIRSGVSLLAEVVCKTFIKAMGLDSYLFIKKLI